MTGVVQYVRGLGYRGAVVHYVGMSHYYRLERKAGDTLTVDATLTSALESTVRGTTPSAGMITLVGIDCCSSSFARTGSNPALQQPNIHCLVPAD